MAGMSIGEMEEAVRFLLDKTKIKHHLVTKAAIYGLDRHWYDLWVEAHDINGVPLSAEHIRRLHIVKADINKVQGKRR